LTFNFLLLGVREYRQPLKIIITINRYTRWSEKRGHCVKCPVFCWYVADSKS